MSVLEVTNTASTDAANRLLAEGWALSAWSPEEESTSTTSSPERKRRVRLYHVSDHPAEILEHGFVDGDSFYHSGKLHRGVWLFDRPSPGGEESAAGDSKTVVLNVPDDVALRHEWLQEGRD
jgi:hypothetical protein